MAIENAQSTGCCALIQLHVYNFTKITSTRKSLKAIKLAGYRAVFVVTKGPETRAAKRLPGLGFKQIAEFSRRIQYADPIPLTMWIKKF